MPVSQPSAVGGYLEALWELLILTCSLPRTAAHSNAITISLFSRDYLKKWSAKGIQVVSWTVNTFDEKNYYESHLGSSYITDSMLEDCAPHF